MDNRCPRVLTQWYGLQIFDSIKLTTQGLALKKVNPIHVRSVGQCYTKSMLRYKTQLYIYCGVSQGKYSYHETAGVIRDTLVPNDLSVLRY